MVAFATAHTGITVEHEDIEAAPLNGPYDGIRANASLLHLEPEALNRVVKRFKEVLSAEGVLYISFKYGEEAYVKDGRCFYIQTIESVK